VLNTVAYSFVFALTAIAVRQLFNSLAQALFPIKLKSGARDSLVMAAGNFYQAPSTKTTVTISVSLH
jgi:hypothetical protein